MQTHDTQQKDDFLAFLQIVNLVNKPILYTCPGPVTVALQYMYMKQFSPVCTCRMLSMLLPYPPMLVCPAFQ